MKTNKILGFIGAFLVAIIAIGLVAAGNLAVSIDEVSVNDVAVRGSQTVTLSGAPEETVPVVVKFTANDNLDNLKLKVWIDGYKNEISASTSRFDVKNGSTYIKRLALTLPSVEDMDDVNERLTLHIRIANKNDEVKATYSISVERDSYVFDILSVEGPSSATAGDIIALDIVLKNIGAHELEDAFVVARIPELGVSKKAYFGDLTPEDDAEAEKDDARERRIYLAIPADAKSGDYALEVKAYNYDATKTVKKAIYITGLAAESNKTVVPVENKEGVPTSIIVLTVVLVIIFVVLLVVLVVLLTKKPNEKVEDFGETSYY